MKLYTYFRSSAAYRVRIALNLKQLSYEQIPVHLVKDGGQQLLPAYRQINPDGLVPALIGDNDEESAVPVFTQSLAIMEYLEELYPQPSLLPANPAQRAYVRSLALSIACDIHPINNLRVLRYLGDTLKISDTDKDAWYRHWCEQGLQALETTLTRNANSAPFCFGDTPTLADCCLVPQVYNARRFKCDLSLMPTIVRIHEHCMSLSAFQAAAAENQPDAS